MSYDNFAPTFSNSRKNLFWPEIEYIIKDLQKFGYRTVLDIGCGNGRFLGEKEKLWYTFDRYLGIDSSWWMIFEAQKLHPNREFAAIPMQDIDTISWWFDALIFLASFHHLESRKERIQVLKNAKKLLNPNGRIYMTNWNLQGQVKYEKSHRWEGEFDIKIGEFSRYYHGFNVEELAELFEETGFRIIENRIFETGKNLISILE